MLDDPENGDFVMVASHPEWGQCKIFLVHDEGDAIRANVISNNELSVNSALGVPTIFGQHRLAKADLTLIRRRDG